MAGAFKAFQSVWESIKGPAPAVTVTWCWKVPVQVSLGFGPPLPPSLHAEKCVALSLDTDIVDTDNAAKCCNNNAGFSKCLAFRSASFS